MCTETELAEYHDWVDRAENAHYEATKSEREHLEKMQEIIDAIELHTPLTGLGIGDAEEILTKEDKRLDIDEMLDIEGFPPLNDYQWSKIKEVL